MRGKLNSPWISVIVGIALIGFSFYSYTKTDKFIDKSVYTTGVVVDVYIKKDNHSSNRDDDYDQPEYCPIIAFVTESGDSVEFKSTAGSTNFDTYKVGKEVDIMYDPDNPVHARIKMAKEENKWQTMMAGGFGIIIIGIGVFGLIKKRKIITK